MILDYAEYEALFNTGDDEALVDRYFHKDVIFQCSSQAMKGHAELRKFLAWVIRKLPGETDTCRLTMVFVSAKLRPGDTVSVSPLSYISDS